MLLSQELHARFYLAMSIGRRKQNSIEVKKFEKEQTYIYSCGYSSLMKAQGPGMQCFINSLLGNGIKITMLMKDAIITSKVIFLP